MMTAESKNPFVICNDMDRRAQEQSERDMLAIRRAIQIDEPIIEPKQKDLFWEWAANFTA